MDNKKIQQAKSILATCISTHFSQVPTNDDGWKELRMHYFEIYDLLEATDSLLHEGLTVSD